MKILTFPNCAQLMASLVLFSSSAIAAVAISNPVGSSAGTTLNIGDESFSGFRFTVDGTLEMSGVTASFASSDGSPLVVAILEAGGSGFPSVSALNPGHPDLKEFGIYDMSVISSSTMVTIPFPATLESGEYVMMFVSMAFGDVHSLDAYQAVSGSDGVEFTQELDGNGFIINGSMAWNTTVLQPDIRIEGTLIPEPSSATLIGLAGGLMLFRRRAVR